MKKIYTVYKISTEIPMVRSKIKPGCTVGNENGALPESVKVFDDKESAFAELKNHTSFIYPRVECRKAYYEVIEWRMEEKTVNDNNEVIEENICGFADMDLSELNENDDYMP